MAPNYKSQTLPEQETLKLEPPVSAPAQQQPSTLPGYRKYPEFNNLWMIEKTGDNWLDTKRENDDIGPLWRVHDKLYDVTPFFKSHPGGTVWLERTRGTDITELFETCHFGPVSAKVLELYYVRDALTPRYSPFTFKPDGFYKTLQRKATPIVRKHGKEPEAYINNIQSLLVVVTIISAMIASHFQMFPMLFISGIALCLLTNLSHNYLHQKDSFRMYGFDLSFLSHDEWRVTHVMSHHVQPNSTYDWEIVTLEPFLNFFAKVQPWYQNQFALITFHFVGAFGFFAELCRRIFMIAQGKQELRWFNLIPFIGLLIPMLIVSTNPILSVIYFFIIENIASYSFLLIGLTIGHHHPDSFHDGDAPRIDRDWGLCQLDSIQDRNEFFGNRFLAVTFFADHSLHHMFPTVDHSKLPLFYPIFFETCKEFGHDFGTISQWEAGKGCFQMLLKTVGRKLGHDVKVK